MFCTACGEKNAANNRFCRQCGHKLEPAATNKVNEDAFDRALPDDEQATALVERAYRLRKSGDLPGAIALCQEVLTLKPASTTAHGLLGQLYEQNGERARAVEQYERVLELNPGSIADRVKLDQLRDGPLPSQPGVKPKAARIVVVDHTGTPLPHVAVWGAAIGLLLLCSGGVIALLVSRHNDGERANIPANSRVVADNSAGQGNGHVPTEKPAAGTSADGGVKSAVTDSAANGAKIASAQPYSPAFSSGVPEESGVRNPLSRYGYPAGPGISSYPPGYYSNLPQAPQNYGRGTPAVVPAAVAGPPRASASPPAHVGRDKAPPETDMQGSDRVRLDTHEGGQDSGVVIHVTRHTDDKSPKSNGPRIDTDAGGGHIIVTPHKDTGDAPAANPPTSEASGYISVGQEKLNKMDYVGALAAFRLAAAGSNDDAGYVYEKMGECFRQRSDNKNAITCYENALREYKKLVSAGRQADRARDGIRICETGIKICSSE